MLRFLFNFILFFFLLGIVLFCIISYSVIPKLPNISSLQDVKLQIPLRIYSQDNSLIAEFGEKKRQPITIDQVPQIMIKAFLAAEDARFYEHPGVDWRALVRATIQLIKTRNKTQGASTITMQVARNFFLSREKTYMRKINEIFLALKIERELPKDKIMELYLNRIYLGHRSYGIVAAAQTYYGADINELTLAQIATLAALPKAPSGRNPITNPTKAKNRRNYVLRRMLEENFISEQDYQTESNAPITATLHKPRVKIEAPYVAEMVRKQMLKQYGDNIYIDGLKVTTTIQDKHQIAAKHALRKTLSAYDERHGYRGYKHQYNLDPEADEVVWKQLLESFHIIGELYPSLVIKINEQSITAFSSGIGLVDIEWSGLSWANPYIDENRRGAKPGVAADILKIGAVIWIKEDNQGQWKLAQIPEIEGAFVSIDPSNGAILALVGGFDFQKSKFNRVTQAYRQPGSGFKPFIYSAGLATGKTAATIINDVPISFDDPGVTGIWQPENYSHKNYGPTRLREALIHSRNLVSIRLLDEIGLTATLEHIKKFGFNIDKLPKNLSLSLGSAILTPLRMVSAYSVFANGGYMVEPHFIKTISARENEIIYHANPATVCQQCPQQGPAVVQQHTDDNQRYEELQTDQQGPKPVIAKRVIDERNAWIINSITQDVIKYGTGRKALTLKRNDLSGKTGTTNNQRDTWFYGYNTNIVAVAWVGFDKFQPLGAKETGARTALPMWIEYMKTALEDIPENILPRPPGLVYSRINRATGEPAKAGDNNTMFEIFRKEYAPRTDSKKTLQTVPNDQDYNKSLW